MIELSSEKFDEAINSEKLCVVEFSASWCMPCRMLKPIMEKVSSKLTGFSFYNVDIDEGVDVAKRYRIFSVPTLVCFKNGKKIDSMVGLNTYDDIVDFLNRADKTEIEE